MERIGRLTTSKRFGRGPQFYVVTDSAPANYYMVPLLKEKPSPYDFDLELKGAALAEKESELAKLKGKATVLGAQPAARHRRRSCACTLRADLMTCCACAARSACSRPSGGGRARRGPLLPRELRLR